MNEDYILLSSPFIMIIMNGSDSVTANAFLANNDDILELTEDFDIQVQHMASGGYFVFGCPITINILDSENTGEYPEQNHTANLASSPCRSPSPPFLV